MSGSRIHIVWKRGHRQWDPDGNAGEGVEDLRVAERVFPFEWFHRDIAGGDRGWGVGG